MLVIISKILSKSNGKRHGHNNNTLNIFYHYMTECVHEYILFELIALVNLISINYLLLYKIKLSRSPFQLEFNKLYLMANLMAN